MNAFGEGFGEEARLEYLDGDYEILRPGSFVKCAVTGDVIPLTKLRYWSVDAQEAYRDAIIATEAMTGRKPKGA